MNKKLLLLLGVIMVLSIGSISALAASPGGKGHADGVWCYMPTGLLPATLPGDEYVGDPDKQFMAASYVSEWTGIFTGTSMDYGLAVAHGGVPMLFIGTSSFTDVEVGGKVGDLEMDAIGDRPDPSSDWRGTWAITGGTGDLENLEGRGAFWGPGWPPPEGGTDECPDGYGVIYYSVDGRFRRPLR